MKRILSLLLLLVGVAHGQGSLKGDAVLGGNGIPVPFPTVRVCTAAATTGGNPNTPCAPLDQVFTDATLSTTAPNPFTGDQGGNFQFFSTPGYHQVQICAAGLSCTMYPTLLAPDANNFGTMFGAAVVSNCGGASAFCTPALTGAIRLSPTDAICWRNAAGTADVCLTLNSLGQIVGSTAAQAVAASLISATQNPAATGLIRLAQGDTACWRNAAGVADDCVQFNGNDYFSITGSGFLSPQFKSSNSSPAASGVVRLSGADSICWRNQAGTADVCISKNGSDQIIGISASGTTQLISATTPTATTGVVEMAASDLICWRNQANTANICISKNAADQLVQGSGAQVDTLNVSGSPGLLLPAATNGGQLWVAGGTGSTIGRIFTGDGTGNFLRFSQRTGSVTTDLGSISDAGTIAMPVHASTNAVVAATGQVRLGASDTICWRNNPNSADVCFSLTAGNAIQATSFSLTGTVTIGTLTFSADNTPSTQAGRFTWVISATTNQLSACAQDSVHALGETLPNNVNGVTFRQLDVWFAQSGSGASTVPVFAIKDLDSSTTACSVTMGNGSTFNSSTCTLNVPVGHHVVVQVTTAASGGTLAQGCVFTTWYTMN